MKLYDFLIVTDIRYLEDSKTNTYKHNVFYKDFLVLEALQAKNLNAIQLA